MGSSKSHCVSCVDVCDKITEFEDYSNFQFEAFTSTQHDTEGAPATLLTSVWSEKRMRKSNSQVTVIRKIFNKMDIDGNGKVTLVEVSKSLRASTEIQRLFGLQYGFNNGSGKGSGTGNAAPTPAFFAEQISKLDKDGDGTISYDEFQSYFFPSIAGCADPVTAWSKLWTLFQSFDINDDGKVDVDEFMAGLRDGSVLTELFGSERPTALQDKELGSTLRDLVTQVDNNNDGQISWLEFSAFFRDRCGTFSD